MEIASLRNVAPPVDEGSAIAWSNVWRGIGVHLRSGHAVVPITRARQISVAAITL